MTESLFPILVVDDEENMRFMLSEALTLAGYPVECAATGAEAIGLATAGEYGGVVLDLRMPGMDGLETLKILLERRPELPVIMMSAYGDLNTAVEAVKAGAADYLPKPFNPDDLVVRLEKIFRTQALEEENRRLRSKVVPEEKEVLIGKSRPIQDLLAAIEKVAAYQTTVLITGESGTGKEMVARMIHRQSPRREGSFVAINCAAIPENLLESELFGYRKGAFTGAYQDKTGLFQEASGGTLFLDEVGEIPPNLQVKLLRALQERTVRRVGSTVPEPIDVRLVAATAQDLKAAIGAGRFREDLYYRLNVVPIHIPPLRDRKEDIPLLGAYFIGRYSRMLGKAVEGFSPEALRFLSAGRWEGNIRQLENIVERAVVMTDDPVIGVEDLPPEIRWSEEGGGIIVPPSWTSLKKAKGELEKVMIRRALDRTGGNRTRAAQLLGIDRKSLRQKIEDLDLDSR